MKWVTLFAGLSLGGFFLWLAIRDTDLETLIASLKTANFWWSVPFLAILCAFYWLKTRRWAYLLSPTRRFTDKELFAPLIIGFAGNNVLPMRLGEFLRIYLLSKTSGISKTLVFATLVLERVFDALCVLALIAFAIVFVDTDSIDLSTASLILTLFSVVAVIAIVVIVHPPPWLLQVSRFFTKRLPVRLYKKFQSKAIEIRKGFESIASRNMLFKITLNSMSQWILLGICIHMSIMAFEIQTPFLAAIVVLGLIVVGISIPSAPGFVGTIELCFVLGLALFGVDASKALAIAIFYHALTFVFVTTIGAFFAVKHKHFLGKKPS